MGDTPEYNVPYDTTEGLLYRALCVMIERNRGHVEITGDELEAVSGRFVMSARADTLILSMLRGEDESEH